VEEKPTLVLEFCRLNAHAKVIAAESKRRLVVENAPVHAQKAMVANMQRVRNALFAARRKTLVADAVN
tara:strand:+ start:1087 stop:1290 length:204 start_codon:yes stop_codon:yes gene_type:complete